MQQLILPPNEDVITMDELHRRLLYAAIERTEQNCQAYAMLGISERTFYRWLDKYKIANGDNKRTVAANAE